MLWNWIFGGLAVLSLVITIWQWLAARRFPLHARVTDMSFAPAVTLLKPLKGCDVETIACLRSWLRQTYAGPVQVLFGVADEHDPVCALVRQLLTEFPSTNAELVICGELLGANAKVSTLIHLQRRAAHEHIIVSDADVRVPSDFLQNVLAPLRDSSVGLVNCFYMLANPTTPAMRWEAVAINADFWSQVLQSQTLKPLDFALGAVMATRRAQLEEIGGFTALVDFLADDYQLGNRIARCGHRIALCPVVVECWERPMNWREVWAHQLRWARTIRGCQPLPYFFSILSNATVWPLLWLVVATLTGRGLVGLFNDFIRSACFPWNRGDQFLFELAVEELRFPLMMLIVALLVRLPSSSECRYRLTNVTTSVTQYFLPALKDLLQAVIWACSFLGNTVVWRGQRYRVLRGGKLVKV